MNYILGLIHDNWAALVSGALLAGLVGGIASMLDTKGSVWIHVELERLRSEINQNPLMSQIAADDALISILEATIPVVLHDFDDTVHQTIASGNLGAVNWKDFGKRVWAECSESIKGGANDYLKSSSYADGEAIAAYISKRFFVTQKMSAKGLVVDKPRANLSDITSTTVKQVSTEGSVTASVVSQDVHTEAKI